MKDFSINREYKDRLFVFLFGNEEYKENALSLYNAVNGTDYDNPNDLTFYTIQNVIYIRMKNDVAVLFDSRLSLWEHQSTFNPNMPLRGMMYFGKLYDKYISETHKKIYGKNLVKIPTPQYYVFYNGTDNRPAVENLRLSDSFESPDKSGDFEWTARMYNLNSGKNEELLNNCVALSGYMTFVNAVRSNIKAGISKDAAVDHAVRECIGKGILSDIFLRHRAEVVDMILEEFNEELFRESMMEEGYEKGRTEGRESTIYSLVQSGKLTRENGAEELGITVEELDCRLMENR